MMDVLSDLSWDTLLPLIFASLMGLSILVYVVLDGFDLGVGILTPFATEEERDIMIGSIGPFWDANETWLVLAVGLLLTAFPVAHGVILTALYLPATLMLIGLILRGVAFEFRAKAPVRHKRAWDNAFFAGSVLASACQGYMLGVYILGLDQSAVGVAFGLFTAFGLMAAYTLIGGAWLIAKTEGALRSKSVAWARYALWGGAAGMTAVSVASPLNSERIFEKWFSMPEIFILSPLPLLSGALFLLLFQSLRRARTDEHGEVWRPFVLTVGVFMLGFIGMAYSFYPFVVPEQMTIWDAASATSSLAIMLVGGLITLPIISFYSIYVFVVFRGKATALRYE